MPSAFHVQHDCERPCPPDAIDFIRLVAMRILPSARASRRFRAVRSSPVLRRADRIQWLGQTDLVAAFRDYQVVYAKNRESERGAISRFSFEGRFLSRAAAWSGYGCKPAARLTRSASLLMTQSGHSSRHGKFIR
jgi:hypothetical protein